MLPLPQRSSFFSGRAGRREGRGEIEWEEYLLVMGKKKNEAARKGAGLFQKMAMKAEEAARRKEEQILKRQAQKEAALAVYYYKLSG